MKNHKVIELRVELGTKTVNSKNIVFIRTNKTHSIITLNNDISFKAFHSIGWFDRILPKPTFCRCHNSYIVNCSFIDSMNYTTQSIFILDSKITLPYSRKYKNVLLDNLHAFVLNN